MIHFPNNLRYLRKQKNLSQTELGRKTGLSRGNISAYEKGTSLPNVKKLYTIAQFFDISLDHLVTSELTKPQHRRMNVVPESIPESKTTLHGNGDLMSLQIQNSRFAKMLQGIKHYHRFKQDGEKPYPIEFRNILIDVERLADISMALLQQNTFLISNMENSPKD